VRAPGARPRKTVAQSKAELTELMLPNDANPMGKILGGKVLHLIDVAGAIAAHRHSRSAVVTASIDNVDFLHPVHVGDLLVLRSSVNYAGRTSMEVGVKVTSENPVTGEIRHTSTAYLTFVAINEKGERIEVPEIVPESTEEKRRYREAKERRRLRLERVANRRPPRS
jgi:acyl-CoA hydrolase